MSSIHIVPSKSQTGSYLLDAPTPVCQGGFSAISRKPVVASRTTSSPGVGLSRGGTHKLTDPLTFTNRRGDCKHTDFPMNYIQLQSPFKIVFPFGFANTSTYMELAPPCPSTNSTLLTMAFSSRITPHSVHTEAPEAPCSSMCVDPQFGQTRPDSAVAMANCCVVRNVNNVFPSSNSIQVGPTAYAMITMLRRRKFRINPSLVRVQSFCITNCMLMSSFHVSVAEFVERGLMKEKKSFPPSPQLNHIVLCRLARTCATMASTVFGPNYILICLSLTEFAGWME